MPFPNSIHKYNPYVYSRKNPLSAIYVVICIVAFTQGPLSFNLGVVGLSDLAISYLYKDDFKLSPAQVSVISSVTSMPWIIKPLWGVISDSVPFLGFKRKSYLIFFGFLQSISWLCLSSLTSQVTLGVLLLMTVQISVSFCNVIAEALLVEISRDSSKPKTKEIVSEADKQKSASKNVSLFFSFKNFGKFLTAYLGGLLLEYIGKFKIFRITSVFPFVLGIASTLLPEKKQIDHDHIRREEENFTLINYTRRDIMIPESNFMKVITYILQPQIFRPIFFIFVFMATPSLGSSMFYFYTNKLKFPPEFMGQLKLIHALANMIGIWIYHKYLKNIPFQRLFFWSTIICTFCGLTQIMLVTRVNTYLHIPDKVFCLFDSLVIEMFAEINTIPILVLACRFCPKNIEGTVYALIMSSLNFGNMVSFQLGGFFMHILNINENSFDNLWKLICISNLSMLLLLPFLSTINFSKGSDSAEGEEDHIV